MLFPFFIYEFRGHLIKFFHTHDHRQTSFLRFKFFGHCIPCCFFLFLSFGQMKPGHDLRRSGRYTIAVWNKCFRGSQPSYFIVMSFIVFSIWILFECLIFKVIHILHIHSHLFIFMVFMTLNTLSLITVIYLPTAPFACMWQS